MFNNFQWESWNGGGCVEIQYVGVHLVSLIFDGVPVWDKFIGMSEMNIL